jgi:hypothetical protein
VKFPGTLYGVITLVAASSLAGELAPSRLPVPTTYGSSESSVSVSALSFMPYGDSGTYYTSPDGERHATGTPDRLGTSVSLPNGALILGLELRGCDLNPTSNILFSLSETDATGSFGWDVLANGATSGEAGCAAVRVGPTAWGPHKVANGTHQYYLTVLTEAGDNTTRFAGVRVIYQLQVSNPPGVSSFNDVATNHPYFKFVEALKASGATAGCGGGNFCVNSAITRGEVAVWLAVLLGLQFPN